MMMMMGWVELGLLARYFKGWIVLDRIINYFLLCVDSIAIKLITDINIIDPQKSDKIHYEFCVANHDEFTSVVCSFITRLPTKMQTLHYDDTLCWIIGWIINVEIRLDMITKVVATLIATSPSFSRGNCIGRSTIWQLARTLIIATYSDNMVNL